MIIVQTHKSKFFYFRVSLSNFSLVSDLKNKKIRYNLDLLVLEQKRFRAYALKSAT